MEIDLDMSGLKENVDRFKKAPGKVKEAFRLLTMEVRRDLKLKSPVDKRNFYRSWNIPPTKVFHFDIRNTADYADAVVFGSVVGSKPWPSAGKKTSEIGGRVWSNKMLENPPNVGTFEQTVLDEDRLQSRFNTLISQELNAA